MSNYSQLHGVIEVPMSLKFSEIQEINKSALYSLGTNNDYPYLSKSMFSITPPEVSYQYQAIHFASTMKGLEEEWLLWLSKFEQLLSRMSWSSVTVYLNTEYYGKFEFEWVAKTSGERVEKTKSWSYVKNPNIIINS